MSSSRGADEGVDGGSETTWLSGAASLRDRWCSAVDREASRRRLWTLDRRVLKVLGLQEILLRGGLETDAFVDVQLSPGSSAWFP